MNCPVCGDMGTIIEDQLKTIKSCSNESCRVLQFDATGGIK
ncbi:MAG: hypothetical protein O6761_00330 [Thaumarchaeota archaeon]|nr:hypothetical protein [Nitrososphaerota archaeon]